MTSVPQNLKGRWLHVKTGGVYLFIALAQIEATGEPAVVYEALDDKGTGPAGSRVWVRPLSEFTDGRFVREAAK